MKFDTKIHELHNSITFVHFLNNEEVHLFCTQLGDLPH